MSETAEIALDLHSHTQWEALTSPQSTPGHKDIVLEPTTFSLPHSPWSRNIVSDSSLCSKQFTNEFWVNFPGPKLKDLQGNFFGCETWASEIRGVYGPSRLPQLAVIGMSEINYTKGNIHMIRRADPNLWGWSPCWYLFVHLTWTLCFPFNLHWIWFESLVKYPLLVGGFNSSEKYWPVFVIAPNIWKNKKGSKPPTSQSFF